MPRTKARRGIGHKSRSTNLRQPHAGRYLGWGKQARGSWIVVLDRHVAGGSSAGRMCPTAHIPAGGDLGTEHSRSLQFRRGIGSCNWLSRPMSPPSLEGTGRKDRGRTPGPGPCHFGAKTPDVSSGGPINAQYTAAPYVWDEALPDHSSLSLLSRAEQRVQCPCTVDDAGPVLSHARAGSMCAVAEEQL